MRTFYLFSLVLILFLHEPAYSQNGLKADYFNGTNFDQYVTTRIETKIDQSWNDKPPVRNLDPHDCSIRYTGFLRAPETGVFVFSAKVDDGIRVWLGDRLIIDQWKLNDSGAFEAAVSLKEGDNYKLKVEYFNALVEGEIQLIWSKPSDKSVFGSYFSDFEVIGYQHFNHDVSQISPQKSTSSKPASKAAEQAKQQSRPTPKPEATVQRAEMTASQISTDTIEKYIPENVHFVQSKASILPESKEALDKLASFLVRYPRVRVTIEGHTDVIGEPDVNQKLSEERAKTVANYLESKGVTASRMQTMGFGSTKPLFPDDKEMGNPKNRRVVFLLD